MIKFLLPLLFSVTLFADTPGQVINVTCPSNEFLSAITPSSPPVCSTPSGGGGGANVHLSNLDTTAFNADIIPGTDGSRSLGATTKQVLNAWIQNIRSDAVLSMSPVGGTKIVGTLAQGTSVQASGVNAHAEGLSTSPGSYGISTGAASHSEGGNTIATGDYSHAEGAATTASGQSSHAEGSSNNIGATQIASGQDSHVEGTDNTATAQGAHAEGGNNVASGDRSHAEGQGGHAVGTNSHTEGQTNEANGNQAHAEGDGTSAAGEASSSHGIGTIASGDQQAAFGMYNIPVGSPNSPASTDELFTVGFGSSGDAATAFAILRDGSLKDGSGSVGSSGNVLTSNGVGTPATWQAGGGGGFSWATPVNSSVTFDTDQTYDFGAPDAEGSSIYFANGVFSFEAVAPHGYFDDINPNAGSVINFTAPVDMGGSKISSVLDPTSAQDAATKNYVDTHGGGITSLSAQTGATQIFANDANVVMTHSSNTHTLGWVGTLALTRGGTGAALTAVNGGLVYSDASKMQILAAGTAGQVLLSGGAGAPVWTSPSHCFIREVTCSGYGSGSSNKMYHFNTLQINDCPNGDAVLTSDSVNGDFFTIAAGAAGQYIVTLGINQSGTGDDVGLSYNTSGTDFTTVYHSLSPPTKLLTPTFSSPGGAKGIAAIKSLPLLAGETVAAHGDGSGNCSGLASEYFEINRLP